MESCVFGGGGPRFRESAAGVAGYWLEWVLGRGAVPRPVLLVVLMSFYVRPFSAQDGVGSLCAGVPLFKEYPQQ